MARATALQANTTGCGPCPYRRWQESAGNWSVSAVQMVMQSVIRWSGKTHCFTPCPNTGLRHVDQGPGTVLGGFGCAMEVVNQM